MALDLLRQFEQWAAELESLDCTLRRAGAVCDSLELQEQIHCYRGILTASRNSMAARTKVSARSVLPARRSIDLLAYPCLETGSHGMIRRANQSASVFFNVPLP